MQRHVLRSGDVRIHHACHTAAARRIRSVRDDNARPNALEQRQVHEGVAPDGAGAGPSLDGRAELETLR